MSTQRLTVRDVSGHAFIAAYAEHLKKGGKIEVPKWAEYIKTGVARELGPLADDWYFHRAGECCVCTSRCAGTLWVVNLARIECLVLIPASLSPCGVVWRCCCSPCVSVQPPSLA
jgi:hypothetical protein